jgi:23S rRNA (cytosine1962-C5)-methyltransferase
MVAATGGDLRDGGTAYVYDQENKFLGSAIYNSNSRICARQFSLDRVEFDNDYIESAIREAANRRSNIFEKYDTYRVVFSDSDFVPGLIVDKIGNCLSVQLLTLAVDERSSQIVRVLQDLFSPQAIVLNRSSAVREKEGLSISDPEVIGDLPAPVEVEQDGFKLYANLTGGQKTGLFLDHRFNRRLLTPYCKDKRVLDLFCYVGAWSLSAARDGASEVIGVDSSADAIELARRAAEVNGYGQVSFVDSDAFDFVTQTQQSGGKFDVIVCDPPAFAKTRKHVPDAIKAYLSLNYRAMKMLPTGGILITSSCSQHVSHEEFREMLETAARNARMHFHILKAGSQPPDHPILLGLPETDYLKCYLLQRVQ